MFTFLSVTCVKLSLICSQRGTSHGKATSTMNKFDLPSLEANRFKGTYNEPKLLPLFRVQKLILPPFIKCLRNLVTFESSTSRKVGLPCHQDININEEIFPTEVHEKMYKLEEIHIKSMIWSLQEDHPA